MRHASIFMMLIVLSCAAVATVNAAEELTRSVESFDFFIDGSSSMRGDQLGKVLKQVNDKIPDLGYPESGIHTFAPESMVLDFELYNRSRFADGIDKLMDKFPGGKNTSLGKGFDFNGPMYSDMLRKSAVIVFTDGDYGNGRDSFNEAKIFYLTQPEMCLHFVSFARNDKAQKLIDDMSSINTCTVSVLAGDLVDNDDNIDNFVRRVFYDAKEIADPIFDFVMLSIPFGFDSDKLDESTAKVTDAVIERLKAQPSMHLKIEGFTCILGPVAYNLELSKRRSASVKNYIVNSGIERSRIDTGGFGVELPRYDNNTREGRSLNRRVEFTFFVPEDANKANE